MEEKEFKNLFSKSTVLVTGATGLIGKALTKKLISYGAVVLAQVRDKEKAVKLFGNTHNVIYVDGDVRNFKLEENKVDYIIHTASMTSSKAFIEQPIETIDVLIEGTRHVLELARKRKIKKFIYLSTMEVYGAPHTDRKIDELYGSNLNTMSPRNCYPESKRMCENICSAYAAEYNIPVNVLRLTQTFGQGVAYKDNRVFAEFARNVIENNDIVLKTKGETKRSYLHVDDAVDAILTVMKYAPPGEAYNVANEATYCSIYEMAQFVAKKIADNNIKVLILEENIDRYGYAPVLHMNLDTNKIQKLGWSPKKGLEDMYNDMIFSMKKGKEKETMRKSL